VVWVRRSFELAARTLPVDMIYYDNGGDPEKALMITTTLHSARRCVLARRLGVREPPRPHQP
jgi:hypothetical protein